MSMSATAGEVAPVPTPPRPAPYPRLRLYRAGDAGRSAVEAFVRQVYAERFEAEVPGFAPVLVGLHDDLGLAAAAGYRAADGGPLFLERYLDAPVQSMLAPHAGTAPARASIVEVGHLAAIRAGAGRQMIRLLGPQLAAEGFDWVVGTLTEELRHLMLRLGVTPLALGSAQAEALGDEARHWGRYYEHRPMVLAGRLRQALPRLARQASPSAPQDAS